MGQYMHFLVLYNIVYSHSHGDLEGVVDPHCNPVRVPTMTMRRAGRGEEGHGAHVLHSLAPRGRRGAGIRGYERGFRISGFEVWVWGVKFRPRVKRATVPMSSTAWRQGREASRGEQHRTSWASSQNAGDRP